MEGAAGDAHLAGASSPKLLVQTACERGRPTAMERRRHGSEAAAAAEKEKSSS